MDIKLDINRLIRLHKIDSLLKIDSLSENENEIIEYLNLVFENYDNFTYVESKNIIFIKYDVYKKICYISQGFKVDNLIIDYFKSRYDLIIKSVFIV